VPGRALANGVAVAVEALIGLVIIQRRRGIVRVRQILLNLGRAAAATVAMGVVIWIALAVLPPNPLVQLVIAGGFGAITYVLVAYWLGIEEIVSLPRALLQGLSRPRAAEA